MGIRKLDTQQVMEIRRRRANGETTTSLAKAFGVDRSQITRIAHGDVWSDGIVRRRSPHVHHYQIVATDMTIVRWCAACGKTWKIIRYATGGLFTSTWEEVKEP